VLNDDPNSLICCYNKSGIYSTHSFYNIINYRGVTPMFIPALWKICVPPKIHLFYGYYLTISWPQLTT
jgi:hypothetical protein